MDDKQATLAAALRLNESMADLSTEMRALRDYGHRNRRYIWGLTISLILDLALSIVVAFVAVQANEASSLAAQNRTAQKTTCEASNQSRLVTTNLWNYVLDLSLKQPNLTPEKQKQISDFRAYMTDAYAQRDCTQLGK
jgi:hypothetical protein